MLYEVITDDFRVVRPDPMLCVAGYPDEMLDRKEKPVCSCFNMERTFLGIHKLVLIMRVERRVNLSLLGGRAVSACLKIFDGG